MKSIFTDIKFLFLIVSLLLLAPNQSFGLKHKLCTSCDHTSSNNPTADLTLTSTGVPIDTNLFGIHGENIFVDQQGNERDVNKGNFFRNAKLLGFRVIEFPGTSQGHYIQYLADDTVTGKSFGNGGYNPIPTNNKLAHYGTHFTTSFFPAFIEFAARQDAAVILGAPAVFDASSFKQAIDFANRHTKVIGIGLFWEWNDKHWDACPACGNGEAVRDSSEKVIRFINQHYPGMFLTGDVGGFSYNNPYSRAILKTKGITDSRLYYSESRTTGVRSTASLQEMKDSMDASTARFEEKANDLFEANDHRGVAVTSWYSDGPDPFGGRYPSVNTWLQPYYESGMLFAFIDYSLKFPGRLHYCLFGRYDRFRPDKQEMNQQGLVFTLVAPCFKTGYILNSVAVPHGMSAKGFVKNHHGYIIVRNPTNQEMQVKFISENGSIVPVTKITVLQAMSLGDMNPYFGEAKDNTIGGYTIARIDF